MWLVGPVGNYFPAGYYACGLRGREQRLSLDLEVEDWTTVDQCARLLNDVTGENIPQVSLFARHTVICALRPLEPGAKLKWGSNGFQGFMKKFRRKRRKTGVSRVIRA